MKFTAFERAKQGTGASRRLRLTGRTPAIVYGGENAPIQIELDHNNLWHALKKEAFHASILDMELNGKTTKVLLRHVQLHPFRQLVLHIDFQRVEAGTRLKMKVPLHFSGQESSPAVKTDNCLVTHVLNELQITCSPTDLPEFIAVDLSALTKGVSLHASDLTMPKGVKVVKRGTNDPVIVSVVVRAAEEAPTTAEAVPAATAAAPADAKAASAKKAPAKK